MDDTIIRKRGPNIAGTFWRRDPLGPAFADNFVRANRFLQISLALPEHPDSPRSLWCSADGSLTNRSVFKNLPEPTALIGRLRKDTKLFAPPTPEQENHGRGRHRAYGSPLPTPEQIRQDESVPWQKANACAAGKQYTFDVKLIAPIRWKAHLLPPPPNKNDFVSASTSALKQLFSSNPLASSLFYAQQ